MKYFDAFVGIGGFSAGIKLAISDAECVGYSEVDKYAIKIYEKHFPNRTNYGDIRRIDAGTLPDFDMFCGGFPCQDLSIAGKRAGLCGARSGLFFEIIRIIREKQPRIVFLENVKGLFSSNNGWDFARVLIELDGAGYDVEWQCLNSKDFGVPQNRERVFIIGHSRREPWKPVFPIGESSEGNIEPQTEFGIEGERIWGEDSPVIAQTLAQRDYKGGNNLILRANTGGGSVNSQIRRLTPLECERLQGYADGWTEGTSDTQRYKCLGNAVTVNVITAIVKRMGDVL